MSEINNRFELVKEIAKIDEDIVDMEKYIQLKIKQRDWRGVAEAAVGIREMEARKRTLQDIMFG